MLLDVFMHPARLLFLIPLFPLTAAIADTGYIAGLNPAVRPANAPVITVFESGETWKVQALQGIREPYSGLGFLKDQGAWYTPFNRPNLNGRYDLRGLHSPDKKRD